MKKTLQHRVPLSLISASEGIWTLTNASNVFKHVRSAGSAATTVLTLPLFPPTRKVQDGKPIGISPKKVYVQVTSGTADYTTTPAMKFYSVSAGSTSAPSATELTGTLSGNSVTAGTQYLVYDLAYKGEAVFDSSSNFHAELTLYPDASTTLAVNDILFEYDEVDNSVA